MLLYQGKCALYLVVKIRPLPSKEIKRSLVEPLLPSMDKNFLIQATNDIYRLTLFFPKKEPLRYKMREVADDILASINNSDRQIMKRQIRDDFIVNNLSILNNFFEIAKAQDWVSISDILAVQEKYINLMKEVEFSQLPIKPKLSIAQISDRQEKILSFLKKSGRVQIQEVKQIFPEVTKRTIRRDFEQMLNQGLVERLGEKNNTCYQIKTS